MKLSIKRWSLQNKILSKRISRWSILFHLMFFSFHLSSQSFQNLVPNGSFETYTNCPNNSSQLYFAPPWTAPECNSSDYFNACSPGQNVPHYCGVSSSYPCYLTAKNGLAYVGFYTYQLNYREYIQTQLTTTLNPGTCYFIEFFVSNFQWVRYCTNNVAASLTSTSSPIVTPTVVGSCPILSLTPHITRYGNPVIMDTCKWVQVAGLYTAMGNENYITIGNFKNDSDTDTIPMYPWGQGPWLSAPNAYILVDAVSVFSINPTGNLPWSYRDTTIITGDSVYIGNYMGGNFNPQWSTITGNYIATNAGIYVKPATTSSYVVQYTVCGTPRADTIEVKVVSGTGINEKKLKRNEFKIFPNPATNEVTLEFDSNLEKPKEITITDVMGRVLKQIEIVSQKQKINLEELNRGCYFIQAQNRAGLKFNAKVIKE